ncbi:MAG TPA: hypothetical protein VNY05_40100, partial [Candidatus Acidoferrales bacterium]|nr:hypothetical protein [Candidatus Acidoferrales bacterium]
MTTHFSPTHADVERYRRLRAATDKLGTDIVRHIPERAYDDIGEALGIPHDGVVVLGNKDVSGIMADCCLHDWYDENELNVVQRYAETHPAQPGTDQHFVFNALLDAKYRVLKVRSLVPGAGAHCEDIMYNENLFVMDVGMSLNPVAGWVLATR